MGAFHARILVDAVVKTIVGSFTDDPRTSVSELVVLGDSLSELLSPIVFAGKPAGEEVDERADFWRDVGTRRIDGIKRG